MEKRIQDIRDKLARAVRAQRVCMFVQDSKAALTSDEEKWITTKKGEKGGGGRRFLIDTETGVILKGGPKKMRGKTFSQAFESKQQKKERHAATKKATREKGNALLKKMVNKGQIDKGRASQLRRNMSQKTVSMLERQHSDMTRQARNGKRRDKRRAEKEKSMGLLRQIEGR